MFGPDDPARWQMAEGVPSFQACDALKVAKYKFWESLAAASEKPGSAVEISVLGKRISSRNKEVPTDFAAWSYVCLPDTVGPAWPKGEIALPQSFVPYRPSARLIGTIVCLSACFWSSQCRVSSPL